MQNSLFRLVVPLFAFLLSPVALSAIEWPQEISAEEGTIVVYQPQPEKFEGNDLTGRAAMSLELGEGKEPIFGAFWFEATIDTDKDSDLAHIHDFKVTKVRWPESKDAQEQRFTAIVEAAIPEAGFDISLERLSASLRSAEIEQKSLEQIKNDPPEILFRDELAVLLLYDGEPRFSPVENSNYERALNTPLVVVRNKKDQYFLSSGTFWYWASDAMGPWKPTKSPPGDLEQMLPEPDSDEGAPSSPPQIVSASTPTELIVSQGEPEWQSLTGGQLLYVSNTETPWLRELSTNNMYVLLSGRWFRAKSEEGPWTFVRADELPASFLDIPPDSDIGGLRVSVAGTEEANDALLDAQIPQTAAIQRDTATISVEYDGKPSFEQIDGTEVSYAVNTGSQVLKIDDRYYAVDNAVWFVSASATGPWEVADSIPDDKIQAIPPSSPVYNTTYVQIYESTPEVVYVGYTPGYMWSFPYYGVPIYGTGWYYPPYMGGIYYPRPPTWGFHVGYNPWTGWNFGVSWTNGFFSFGASWGGGYGGYHPGGCCGGWYGGGYRPPVFINNGDINIGNNVNIGDRERVSHNRGNSNAGSVRDNLYNRADNVPRNADRAATHQDRQQARPAANRENNVYADRNGNVARNNNGQWEARQNGSWNAGATSRDNVSPETRQRATDTARNSSFDRSGLDRDFNARQQGARREMNRSRPMRRRR